MPKYKTAHIILMPDRQIAMGHIVTEADFSSPEEVERLRRLGALIDLEGTEDYLAPDQGTDPTPRGAVPPVVLLTTSAEIDAQITALNAQKERVKVQEDAEAKVEAKVEADAVVASNDRKNRNNKLVSGTQATNADGSPQVDQNGHPVLNP